MTEKIISLLLAVVFSLCIVGCSDTNQQKSNGNTTSVISNNSFVSEPTESSTLSNPSSETNSIPVNSTPSNSTSEGQGNTTSNPINSQDGITLPDSTLPSGPNDQNSTPLPDVTTELQTSHKPLDQSQYFQYSTLNSDEKQVYNLVVEAIRNTQNVIDVSGYNITNDNILTIIYRAISDHPEFFWVTKKTSYTHSGGRPFEVLLFYTDGTVNDQLNSELKLTVTADRNKIATQIAQFNATVNSILSDISPSLSDYEKEKKIFEYLSKNIKYDQDNSSKNYNSDSVFPRCFDSYGAACEKLAVCEGYSKLFQYLCYCVGINATQVSGNAHGGGHMWNSVKIDGVWYQTDATWSKYSNSDAVWYKYFHLAKDEMYIDHTTESEHIIIP